MRQGIRVAIENVQCAFTMPLIGSSPKRSYVERYEPLQLDSLWLQSPSVNLVLFNDVITGDSFVSAPSVGKPLPYSSN